MRNKVCFTHFKLLLPDQKTGVNLVSEKMMFLVVHGSRVFHQDRNLSLIEDGLRNDPQHPSWADQPQIELGIRPL